MRWLAATVLALSLTPVAAAEPALWVESPGTMIMPTRPTGAGKAITLRGVRNEFVCAQLALRDENPGSAALSFEWTALKSSSGQIAKDQITLFRAHEVNVQSGGQTKPENIAKDPLRARQYGMYPDALIPLVLADGTNVANSIVPPAGKTLPFWVDIFIPEKTPAGNYEGTITLKSGSKTLATVPVKVEVLNLAIPAEATIPSVYTLRFHDHTAKYLDAYVAELRKDHIQPISNGYLSYAQRSFTQLDKLNPEGKGWVTLSFGTTDPQKAADGIPNLKKTLAHIKERGMLDRTFIYMKDEPAVGDIDGMVEVAKVLLKECPELKGKLLDTLNKDNTKLDPYLSHYSRALKCYGDWEGRGYWGRKDWDEKRAKGQNLWFYFSNAQGTPYPTFDVNTPLGFEPRVAGWAWWYEKALGHLYWDVLNNGERGGFGLSTKFPPGDGQLIYSGDLSAPGSPDWALVKDLKMPVPSRRIKMFREGLEEWELLKVAEKQLGRAKVEQVVDKVYRCMGLSPWSTGAGREIYNPSHPMWSYNEADWDAARDEILKLMSK